MQLFQSRTRKFDAESEGTELTDFKQVENSRQTHTASGRRDISRWLQSKKGQSSLTSSRDTTWTAGNHTRMSPARRKATVGGGDSVIDIGDEGESTSYLEAQTSSEPTTVSRHSEALWKGQRLQRILQGEKGVRKHDQSMVAESVTAQGRGITDVEGKEVSVQELVRPRKPRTQRARSNAPNSDDLVTL